MICGLSDAGTKGRKYIAEQQADQLLAGGCRPILRNFCNERIGGGEHNARVRHDICAAFEGLELGEGAAADEGVISSPRSRVSAVVVKAREDLVLLREVGRFTSR